MTSSVVRYLTVVRASCEALVRSPDDPRARQRLEQACQILNVLICDAKSSARHEETALGQYRRLLEPLRPPQEDAGNFSKTKASICGVIRSPHSLPAARVADFCRQAVEIERKFYLDAERALREESMPREASGNAQGGAIPSAAAVSTYLSGIFGRPVEVREINTVSLGYSKATYLLTMRPSADVPAALVIRMDRPFNYLGTTVVDEYPILTVLHENGIAVPAALRARADRRGPRPTLFGGEPRVW